MCAHEKKEIGFGESMICYGEEVGQKKGKEYFTGGERARNELYEDQT